MVKNFVLTLTMAQFSLNLFLSVILLLFFICLTPSDHLYPFLLINFLFSTTARLVALRRCRALQVNLLAIGATPWRPSISFSKLSDRRNKKCIIVSIGIILDATLGRSSIACKVY